MSTVRDKLGNAWHKKAKQQRRLTSGVEGAHLCILFQCGVCWLQNLEGRDLIDGKDECFLACIKRANLDAMAGKLPLMIVAHLPETTTVVSNAGLVNKMPSHQPRGHLPLTDAVGMGLAVDMLIKSLVARGCIKCHV
jgi:hypothetical protein